MFSLFASPFTAYSVYAYFQAEKHSQRYDIVANAPILQVEEALEYCQSGSGPAPYVKIMGLLTADKMVIPQTGSRKACVLSQVVSQRQMHTAEITRYRNDQYDYWADAVTGNVLCNTLFLASTSSTGFFSDLSSQTPNASMVALCPGAADEHDNLVLPFLSEREEFLISDVYKPSGDVDYLRVRCYNTAVNEYNDAIHDYEMACERARYSGQQKPSTTPSGTSHIELGVNHKEYSLDVGQEMFCAGHLKPYHNGGCSLQEDGKANTPFIISTQPFEKIEAEMRREFTGWKKWHQYTAVPGLLALCADVTVVTICASK